MSKGGIAGATEAVGLVYLFAGISVSFLSDRPTISGRTTAARGPAIARDFACPSGSFGERRTFSEHRRNGRNHR